MISAPLSPTLEEMILGSPVIIAAMLSGCPSFPGFGWAVTGTLTFPVRRQYNAGGCSDGRVEIASRAGHFPSRKRKNFAERHLLCCRADCGVLQLTVLLYKHTRPDISIIISSLPADVRSLAHTTRRPLFTAALFLVQPFLRTH